MKLEEVVKFYEEKGKFNNKKIIRWLYRNKFKKIGEGAFSSVFSKKGIKYVVKISNDWFLEKPRKGSKLEKYFIGYLYLSWDREFGIQQKVTDIKSRSGEDRKRVLRKFKKASLHKRYDIHPLNVGKYKGKWVLIDF